MPQQNFDVMAEARKVVKKLKDSVGVDGYQHIPLPDLSREQADAVGVVVGLARMLAIIEHFHADADLASVRKTMRAYKISGSEGQYSLSFPVTMDGLMLEGHSAALPAYAIEKKLPAISASLFHPPEQRAHTDIDIDGSGVPKPVAVILTADDGIANIQADILALLLKAEGYDPAKTLALSSDPIKIQKDGFFASGGAIPKGTELPSVLVDRVAYDKLCQNNSK